MRVEPEKGMAVSFSFQDESGKKQIEGLLSALPHK
jgi:hypothetical protein